MASRRPLRRGSGGLRGGAAGPKLARMTGLILLEISCPDRATAERIGAALLARRLAACVHLGAPFRSLYRWKGVVEDAEEAPLAAVTRAELFEAAAAAARELHPYETPGILALPLAQATEDYAAWVREETAPRG